MDEEAIRKLQEVRRKAITQRRACAFVERILKNPGDRIESPQLIIRDPDTLTYNPYFIALTTAYLRAFHRHINKGRPSISLLIMDEAFKVLNSEAVRDCVQIIRELGLQGVISCTDTNGGQIVEFFQWAMIVQKRVTAGGATDGHDLIENTIYSAPRNDPEITRLLGDLIPNA